jgi:hypothetical protein
MDRWKTVALLLGGVLIGMLVGPPSSTTAEVPGQFKECVSYCGFEGGMVKESRVARAKRPVPAGWSVVSGAGQCAFLCR